MVLDWKPLVTRELIDENIPDTRIMEHYLGVPCKKGLFRNPLRHDSRPTASFFRDKHGRLIMKDFAGYFCGGWPDVVMTKFNCSYQTALRIVANDFNLVKDDRRTVNAPLIKYTDGDVGQHEDARINVQLRDFTKRDINWWGSFGISETTLRKYDVFPIKNVWLNDHIYYLGTDENLVYGYFGGMKDGNELWKIYFPLRQKFRFVCNWKSSKLQGYEQLPKSSNYLVCTKSMKDVMLLHELDIPAVAPMSETVFMTESQYERLQGRFNRIFLLYDNDLPGITNANKIRRKFKSIEVLIIPRRLGSKDITDYRRDHGERKTKELIEQAKAWLQTERGIQQTTGTLV